MSDNTSWTIIIVAILATIAVVVGGIVYYNTSYAYYTGMDTTGKPYCISRNPNVKCPVFSPNYLREEMK